MITDPYPPAFIFHSVIDASGSGVALRFQCIATQRTERGGAIAGSLSYDT